MAKIKVNPTRIRDLVRLLDSTHKPIPRVKINESIIAAGGRSRLNPVWVDKIKKKYNDQFSGTYGKGR